MQFIENLSQLAEPPSSPTDILCVLLLNTFTWLRWRRLHLEGVRLVLECTIRQLIAITK
ncbi:hypothetical protein SCE1572_39665 [Sorangium cellulosum So0157-2]|uniref:Uncharacterized protein n=1 Tax=Sorangium cellulosum So0157-2 TaxID=1254432 RepID=S4Y3P1_SORCE|nr:hypothetical protein SCE1572_39665 [Sorangium cellulosum So0157-2]